MPPPETVRQLVAVDPGRTVGEYVALPAAPVVVREECATGFVGAGKDGTARHVARDHHAHGFDVMLRLPDVLGGAAGECRGDEGEESFHENNSVATYSASASA